MMMQSCNMMANSSCYCMSSAAAGTSVRIEMLGTVLLAVSIIVRLAVLLVLKV